ncbi:hypothetical protein [Amycolatopsis sp. PS_44_ISF1]|uniref:hypothetical protein n=1 Tax=Amycolatopsis sp. PS_44_ISF1 TaxID=2974917 RepID=UPI0028DF7135|nr:hypothetical protein [Amycolatopsis sp. PS_44_ISF1]MDT8915387.1 hypothetical protein [Amycolatopsis sp. PS_44_ISF1]
MRLVRLGQQPSRVAEDVRAALASLGRGSTVIGGVALVGARPVGGDRAVEAVVVLPRGVLVVIGVDLPDPALRLEAPLDGPWKADGWPLVHGDDAVNPATEALDLSQECERRIAELAPGTGPVGTVIAVGPYVETVDQPPADLAGPVRVLHPTPTTMLAATVSLATARRPRSLDQARALIAAFAPDAPPLPDEVLLGEGFVRFTDDSPVPDEDRVSSLGTGGAQGTGGTAGTSAAGTTVSAGVGTAVTGTAAARAEAAPSPAAVPADQGSAGRSSAAVTSAGTVTAPDSTSIPAVAAVTAASVSGAAQAAAAAPAGTTAPAAAQVPAPAAVPTPAAAAGSGVTAVAPSTESSSLPDRTGPPTPPRRSKIISVPPPPPVFPTVAPVPHVAPPADPPSSGPSLPGPASPGDAAMGPASPGGPSRDDAPVFPGAHPPAGSTSTAEPAERPAASSPAAGAPKADPSDSDADGRAGELTESIASPVRPGSSASGGGPAVDDDAGTEVMAPPPRTPKPGPGRAAPPSSHGPRPPPATPATAVASAALTPAATPPAGAAPVPPSPGEQSRTVRWLPFGAIGLLVVLLVAAVVVAAATGGSGGQSAAPAASAPPVAPRPVPSTAPVSTAPVSTAPVAPTLTFTARDSSGDQRCASHAFGDVQASLQQTSCAGVQRASYAAEVDGRAAAVTVAVVAFPDTAQAAHFKDVADTPGSGGIIDVATETGKWAGPVPQFDGAAYTSKVEGKGVRLVQAVWLPGPSTPDDPGLVRATKGALDLVLPS